MKKTLQVLCIMVIVLISTAQRSKMSKITLTSLEFKLCRDLYKEKKENDSLKKENMRLKEKCKTYIVRIGTDSFHTTILDSIRIFLQNNLTKLSMTLTKLNPEQNLQTFQVARHPQKILLEQ